MNNENSRDEVLWTYRAGVLVLGYGLAYIKYLTINLI